MIIKTMLAAMAVITLLAGSGCSVARDQQTTGAYMDDAAITAQVKTKMLEDKDVAGTSINVETLNGTVMLSGFAKNAAESSAAEAAAKEVDGVKAVQNQIVVRP